MGKSIPRAGLALAIAVVSIAGADGGSPGGTIVVGSDMVTARMQATAVPLADGNVLVVGGRGPGFNSLTNSEIWNAGTGTWSQVEMHAAEHDECAVARLADGRILAAGGAYDYGITPGYASATVFDPATRSFYPTGSLNYARFQAGAARLASGKVLVCGGWYGGGTSAVYGEVYDPQAGTFTLTQPSNVERSSPLVVPCTDGSALVFSGYPPYGGDVYTSVESWDAATGAFTAVRDTVIPGDPDLIPYVGLHLAGTIEEQALADGRFLFTGYRPVGGTYRTVLFTVDPSTHEFAGFPLADALPAQDDVWFFFHPVVDRTRGVAYLLGQIAGTAAEFVIYRVDLASGAVTAPSGSYHVDATYYPIAAAVAVLPDGRLVLAGGHSDQSYSSAIPLTLLVTPDDPPPTTAPAAPSGLAAAPSGPNSVRVSWSDQSTNEESFDVYRSDDGGRSWNRVASVARNATAFDDVGGEPNALRRYKVCAVNRVGDSDFTTEVAARVPGGRAVVSARSIRFGTVRIGRERTRTLTVRNTHRTGLLWVDVESVPGPEKAWRFLETPFEIEGGPQGLGVAPGRKLTVRVTFRPWEPAEASASIRIRTSDPRREETSVALKGKGRLVQPD